MKILFVGSFATGALEKSYLSAANKLGIDSISFDAYVNQKDFIKMGVLGAKVNMFLPIEQWTRKMNRRMVILTQKVRPDVIVLFTNVRILPGSLACIKTFLPQCKVVLVWPDALLNLEVANILSARLYDMVAAFSEASVPVLNKMGFNNVHWVPLASDLLFRVNMRADSFLVDVGFVGGWRPEREKVLLQIRNAFPEFKIAIHGPYWKRDCKDRNLRKCIESDGLYENSMYKFFNSTRINVNIIDDTNYPSANMRFYEIPIASGLQLCSSCPEQEVIYKHREHVIYFQNESDLLDQIKWINESPSICNEIIRKSNEITTSNHTYEDRLRYILGHL
jgi:hypothetical protein